MLTNTKAFLEAREYFEKHGVYTKALKGTRGYYDYWDDQVTKCKEGVTIGNLKIPGEYYFYLNFTRMRVTNPSTGRKIEGFPRFTDVDLEYFNIFKRAREEKKGIILLKPRRTGFEQPNSEIVITPNGETTMGNLKVGDYVVDRLGNPTKVLEIHPQGKKDVYEIEFHDGRKVLCGENHLWKIVESKGRPSRIVNTKFFLDKKLIKSPGKRGQEYSYHIPTNEAVKFSQKELLIDPYILGCIIGDGSVTQGSLLFSTKDLEILNYIKEKLPKEASIKHKHLYQYNIVFDGKVNPILRELKNLGLRCRAENKFIPDIYKYSSIEQRLELLKGLMDTDGSSSPNGTVRFATSSKKLKEDIEYLCRSLGLKCKSHTLKESDNSFKKLEAYAINIVTDLNIFKLQRKSKNIRADREYNFKKIAIKSVTKLDYQEESTCITVDNPEHLYLTRNFIVTHNTYKNSGLATYEYNFYKDSVTCIGAFENKWSDPFIGAAVTNLNFLALHTAWNKPRNPDQLEKSYCKARHQVTEPDGTKVWKGYMSEIWRLTFKDNPGASAGKSTSLFFFEEAGQFDNIIESYNLTEPTWMDGNEVVGTPIIYGTGGDMGKGAVAFSEMYYDPDKYNLLAFDNIWEDDKSNQKCGWFLPASRQRFGYLKDEKKKLILDEKNKPIPLVDDEGNSNVLAAEQDVLNYRKTKKYDRTSITEYPLKPSEGFLITSGNTFPTIALKEQLSLVRGNPDKYIYCNWVGDLEVNIESGEIEQRITPDRVPLRRYPIAKDDDIKGCLEIFEQPQKDSEGNVFRRRYIVASDPYDDDAVVQSDSLGSILVFDRITRRIVAEYTGRRRASEFYEIFRKLIIYYNAYGLGFPEINKIGIVNYFENKNSLYMLAETPISIRDKTEWKPGLNTSFGYKATKYTNAWGNELINDWLLEEIEPGSEIKNLHKVRSTGLLEELIKYHPDGNFDRISCLRGVLILDTSMKKQAIKKIEDKVKTFLDDDFFEEIGMFETKEGSEKSYIDPSTKWDSFLT